MKCIHSLYIHSKVFLLSLIQCDHHRLLAQYQTKDIKCEHTDIIGEAGFMGKGRYTAQLN